MADSTLYSVNPAGYGKAGSGSQGPQGPQGPKGEDGKSAYVYVAYASDATGTGFSLVPTNSLKFRAEIHRDTPLASPAASDFSAATWVKYIGDDGTGGGTGGTGDGDMKKSVYDANDNGVVDTAEKLQVAHKIGNASFNGTQDISLAQIGAQPVLPQGTAGQVLTKSADDVVWSDPPSSLPEGGTAGQVLTKTGTGSEWASLPAQQAAWGGITGSLDSQLDLKAALDDKITNPSGGAAGYYLKKTEAGAEWSAVSSGGDGGTGGGKDSAAVRKVVDAASLEDARSLANDLFVMSGNEFTDYKSPAWSLRTAGNPINDRLLRGHTYRRIRTEGAGGGGGVAGTRQITTNTYKIEKVYLYRKDTGAYYDRYAFMAENANTQLTVDGSYTFTDRKHVDPASNDGWPTTDASVEDTTSGLMDLLQQEGTYIGTVPGILQSPGENGDCIKWTGNGWRKATIRMTNTGEIAEILSDLYFTIKFGYADPDNTNSYSENPIVWSTETSTEVREGHWLNPQDCLLDITPTIMSIEELASAAAVTVWPCRAYSLTLANDTVLTAEGGCTGDIPDFSSNSGNTIDRDLRQESFIDINPGSYNVSADNRTLVLVDEIIPNVINHCRIVWTGQLARLYVYEAELPTFQTGDWYIKGTTNEELSVDLSAKVFSLPPDITPVFTPRPGYALPNGLSLSSGGMISGAPTIATSIGGVVSVFTTYVVVSAPGYMDSRMKLEFEIAQQGTITTTPLTIAGVALAALAAIDTNLGNAVSVSNKRDASYKVASDSALPVGITMSKTGILSGAPATSGDTTTNIIVSARGCPDATLTVSFQIAKGTITTKTASMSGTVGTPLNELTTVLDSTVASTNNGQSCSFSVAAGSALPGGLELGQADASPSLTVIKGTPTAAGDYETTLNVTAKECTPATVKLLFHIFDNVPTGTITASDQTVNGTKGQSVSSQLVATASNGMSCSFALAQDASLPAGLAMSATGKITGMPTEAGTSTAKVVVSARGCPDKEITVTFVIADSIPEGTITINGSPTVQGIVGTPLTYNLAPHVSVSNGQTPSFTWNTNYAPKPGWLTVSNTGTLSGTPTSTLAIPGGQIHVAAQGCPTVILSFSWDLINSGTITVSPQTIKGTVGKELSFNLHDYTTVSNSQTPTFSLKPGSGELPVGISLSSNGVFSGTPTAAVSSTVGVRIEARGCSAVWTDVTFNISEAQAGSDDFPVSFTVTSVPVAGTAYSDAVGTYTRTGDTLTLSGVNYPIYSYTGSSGKVYYIHIGSYVMGAAQVNWMLTKNTPDANAEGYASFGCCALKEGTYEPSSHNWGAGSYPGATVSWEMGNAGTPALTAKAFGHPDWIIAGRFSAALQKFTYTGTFAVNGESFPYYTGDGSTPWYLFGGKTRASTASSAPWFYAVYLSSRNPTTITAWTGMEFTFGSTNNTRLIMAGKVPESTGPAPDYSEISNELSTTLLNSDKWWYVNDPDYPQSEQADTITWE